MEGNCSTMSTHIAPVRWPKRAVALIRHSRFRWKYALLTAVMLVCDAAAFAQSDPWTASANNLKTAFTGPIATALIAVAVVVTGMVFAFSEGQGKRQLAGLTFGGAMALGAVRFMAWLFT